MRTILTYARCWSNYLGRQPQLQLTHTNTKKFDVFPSEDSETWSPYTDAGIIHTNSLPARTRAVALQISKLAEISSDLLIAFYQPSLLEKPQTKQVELKKLTDIHTRLEAWKRDLPLEFEAKEGQLPSVLVMHMFFQLLYIHLYRPFLRFTKATSPLPTHISPRKFCTQAASAISKLLRLYKRTHGLRQVINKVVYIAHSACTIHLLNLPEKNAKRDIVHGIKQLEEMGDCWTAARRTLRILCLCSERWQIELPEEAQAVFARTKARWGSIEPSPASLSPDSFASMTRQINSTMVPEMMAQNMQQPAVSQSLSREVLRAFQDQHPGMQGPPAASPTEVPDTRRSSGNFSLPPRSAAEVIRNAGRIRPSTQLTREQQEAWNNLQARLGSQATQPVSRHPMSAYANAQNMFGGIESLIGESQDWWYNDQNQLAQGFDNWTAPTPDWSGLNNANLGMDEAGIPVVGPNAMFAPRSGFEAYPDQINQQPPGSMHNQMMNGTGSMVDGQYQHHPQQLQQKPAYNQAQPKRHMSWDDDNAYY